MPCVLSVLHLAGWRGGLWLHRRRVYLRGHGVGRVPGVVLMLMSPVAGVLRM